MHACDENHHKINILPNPCFCFCFSFRILQHWDMWQCGLTLSTMLRVCCHDGRFLLQGSQGQQHHVGIGLGHFFWWTSSCSCSNIYLWRQGGYLLLHLWHGVGCKLLLHLRLGRSCISWEQSFYAPALFLFYSGWWWTWCGCRWTKEWRTFNVTNE